MSRKPKDNKLSQYQAAMQAQGAKPCRKSSGSMGTCPRCGAKAFEPCGEEKR